MEIYAVAVQSSMLIQSSYRYQIQATNSRGMASTIEFKASINNSPYTSDCRMAMTFKYKLVTETLVDLDIIRSFIYMITQYYGDKKTTVKILDFVKQTGSYKITWSNCSIVFSSRQEAMSGLTESHRTYIQEIFSRIISVSDGVIVAKFRKFMSTYFQITTVEVSYDCIEEPPVPSRSTFRAYATFCREFNDSVPRNTFYDKRDGDTRKLKLSLLYVNGSTLFIDNWVQITETQRVYGILTEVIKQNAPLGGYEYLLMASDFSGRTVNITYIIEVPSPKRVYDVYFTSGFTNHFAPLEPSAKILYTLVHKLSRYINGDDKVNFICLLNQTFF